MTMQVLNPSLISLLRSWFPDFRRHKQFHSYLHAFLYESAGTTLTVSATNTDYQVTGFTGTEVTPEITDTTDDWRVEQPGDYDISYTLTCRMDTAAADLIFAVYNNAARLTKSLCRVSAETAAYYPVAARFIQPLDEDDVISLQVRNQTNTSNIVFYYVQVCIERLGPKQ